MRTPIMLKCQCFEDNETNKTATKTNQWWQLDKRDNKEVQDLDGYEIEVEGNGYVSLLFIILFPLPQKKSNYLSDLDEETRSLSYLVYISKICSLNKC